MSEHGEVRCEVPSCHRLALTVEHVTVATFDGERLLDSHERDVRMCPGCALHLERGGEVRLLDGLARLQRETNS